MLVVVVVVVVVAAVVIVVVKKFLEYAGVVVVKIQGCDKLDHHGSSRVAIRFTPQDMSTGAHPMIFVSFIVVLFRFLLSFPYVLLSFFIFVFRLFFCFVISFCLCFLVGSCSWFHIVPVSFVSFCFFFIIVRSFVLCFFTPATHRALSGIPRRASNIIMKNFDKHCEK